MVVQTGDSGGVEHTSRPSIHVDGDADVAPRPRPVPRSHWQIPPPEEADEDGVVGLGADLAPATLVSCYRDGIFPWPHDDVPLPWFSPDPRAVIPVGEVHLSRSLRRTLRRCGWTTTVDRAFPDVMAACGTDRGEDGTWITAEMLAAYTALHDLGWAHSVEVWDGPDLVGGIYGVQVGGIFTGESMFHRRTDASKVALVDLVQRFAGAGGHLLDVQILTDHLATLGAREVPRADFLAHLHRWRDLDVRLTRGPRAARDLLDQSATPRSVAGS